MEIEYDMNSYMCDKAIFDFRDKLKESCLVSPMPFFHQISEFAASCLQICQEDSGQDLGSEHFTKQSLSALLNLEMHTKHFAAS